MHLRNAGAEGLAVVQTFEAVGGSKAAFDTARALLFQHGEITVTKGRGKGSPMVMRLAGISTNDAEVIVTPVTPVTHVTK